MSIGLSACRAKKEFLTGEELFDNFLDLNFTGASDFLRINRTTGSRMHQTARFIVRNIVAREPDKDGNVWFDTVDTDEYVLCADENLHDNYTNHWVQINGTRFNYSDRTFTPPLPLPPVAVNLNVTQPWLLLLSTVVGSIIMISAVCFGLWTWLHRASTVVQQSQPFFLAILCVGVFLMASTVYSIVAEEPPLSVETVNFFCMFGYWTFFSGFGLIFSALVSKLRCINKVVQNHSVFQRVVVTPKDVLLPGAVIMPLNFIVLLIWQLVAPSVYRREYEDTSFDKFGRYVLHSFRCGSACGLLLFCSVA